MEGQGGSQDRPGGRKTLFDRFAKGIRRINPVSHIIRTHGIPQGRAEQSLESLSPEFLEENKGLVDASRKLDELIPTKDLHIWSEGLHGNHTEREKQFRPATMLAGLQEFVQARFPDPSEQRRILDATGDFIQKLAAQAVPASETWDRDSIALGQLDRFLGAFPANMTSALGEYATPDVITRVMAIGSSAIYRYAGQPERTRKAYGNGPLGKTSLLVGESIPEVVLHAGAHHDTALDEIEKAAQELDPDQLEDLIEYRRKYREPSADAKERLQRFEKKTNGIISGIDGTSPFSQFDRKPWINLADMGVELRDPTWKDLIDMVHSGEEDEREYGLVISQNQDQKYTLGYIRGAKHSIKNKNDRVSRPASSVFFHSHPSSDDRFEATSPLVSSGDMDANIVSDSGGGYLNNVGVMGVTLHVGGELQNKKEEQEQDRSLLPIYTIESGDFKNTDLPLKKREDVAEIMMQVNRPDVPYAYSIYEPVQGIKYYFVHIPWSKLDVTVSLKDLCFKDGLAAVLAGVPNFSEIPKNRNLHEALKSSRRLSMQRADEHLEELRKKHLQDDDGSAGD